MAMLSGILLSLRKVSRLGDSVGNHNTYCRVLRQRLCEEINGADEFFVADFVLVERKTVLGQEFLDLDNVIVLETKLSSTTALTTPQTNALAKVKTTSNTFNVRSVSQPGVFNPTNYSLGNSNQLKIKDYIKVYSDGVGTTVQDIISLK